jgi:dethiobiotin synthetase
MQGYFIAGTDTGVGKTEVSRAILQRWAARGLAPRAVKPIETGCARDAPEDALALREACGAPHDTLPLDAVCPYRFLMPAAPLIAAEAEGREIDPARILSCIANATQGGAPVLVESAGGLLVPLWREGEKMITNLDLAERAGLPVLLIGRAGLGTLNHSALSAWALAQRGLPLAGIFLNRSTPVDDATIRSNARVLEKMTGVKVFGPGPFDPDSKQRPFSLSKWVAEANIA